TAHTLASWRHKLDDLGEAALVRLAQPVNRFPDQVRQLVRDLKQLYPSMGRQRIADTLARTGLVLAASTVRRMVLETPGEPGEGPATGPESTPSQPDVDTDGSTAAPTPAKPKSVTARYTHHVWHCDLTLVPTAAGLWVPWFPFAAWLGWPFAYWVVGVVDQFSRAPIKLKAFKKHPSGREVRRFLRSSIRIAGRAPKHLITDQGVQFRAEYRAWCQRLDIKPRWGAVGSHRSIAVVERLWRSLKAECCKPILVPLKLSAFQAELDIYATWFRHHRPHRALGGRTPEECTAERPPSVPRLEPRPKVPIRGDPDPVRHVYSVELRVSAFAGKKHLPIVELQAA
ncbi:MAG: DDE-type integrase/transposase/recombinase, partial [Myxococcales bacterium]|nr:DDE-type integrase/transposase/recombinase [Myxococcales bacterium]